MERKSFVCLLTLLALLSVLAPASALAAAGQSAARESVNAPALPTALDLELARQGSGVPPAALHPEAVLYDNGPLVTNPGGGAGGADASALQTAVGNSTYGFGHALSSGYRMADDFTVPAGGWTVESITFFAYQTGSGTTSTINHVNLRIWDGVPGASGSNVVFGDTTTNRLAGSSFSNIYRVLDTGLGDSTRPIMASVVTVNQFLPAGTYWLDWQTGGTLSSGPWAVPVTIAGQTQKPGANGLQWDPTASTWNPAMDNGSNTQQDLPFIIEGTAGTVEQPNIDVAPLALASTQGPNTTANQTLTIGNDGEATLTWNIAEEPAAIFMPPAPAAVDARRAPATVGRSVPRRIVRPEAVLLNEGFEGGVVPPTGWTRQAQAPTTWGINTYDPHSGTYYADIEYDPGMNQQSEWLLSPELTLSSGTLSFWSFASVYWCRDNFDNCDLEVWLVVGPTAGDGDDIYVGDADPSWPANWTWAQSTFDLTPLLPGGPVRVGFRYVGLDGAEVALDDIVLDGETGPVICANPADVPWLSEAPTSGTTAPGGSTPVTVTFNSAGLAMGTYTANLCITSNDPNPGPGNGTNLVVVPVELTVADVGPGPSVLEIPTLAPVGGALLGLLLAGLGLGTLRRRRA